VDDEPCIRESFALLLAMSGFAVATAANGLEALAYLRANPLPAVIVSDLMMPGMDGLQLRRALLGDGRLREIPVIFCTARHDYHAHPEVSSAAGFLCKPTEHAELIRAITRYVQPEA